MIETFQMNQLDKLGLNCVKLSSSWLQLILLNQLSWSWIELG